MPERTMTSDVHVYKRETSLALIINLLGNWNSRKTGTGVGMESGDENLQKSLFIGFFTSEVHRTV